jgi:hypothetical protein
MECGLLQPLVPGVILRGFESHMASQYIGIDMQYIIEWILRLLGWCLTAVALFGMSILLIVLAGMTYGGYVEFMKYIKIVTS